VNQKLEEYKTKGQIAGEEHNYLTKQGIFSEIHHQKALELIFGQNKDQKDLVNFIFKDSTKVPNEQIARLGLTFYGSFGKFQFIHRTFAEYFTAEFFFKIIFRQKFESIEQLNDCVHITIDNFNYQPIVFTFLNGALEDFHFNKNTSKAVQVKESLQQFLKFQPISFVKEYPNLILALLQIFTENKNESFHLWTNSEFFVGKLMNVAAEYYSVNSMKKVSKAAKETFEINELKTLIHQSHWSKLITKEIDVLATAHIFNSPEVFGILLPFIESLYSIEEFEALLIKDLFANEACYWHVKCDKCLENSENIEVIRRHLSVEKFKIFMKLNAYKFFKSVNKICDIRKNEKVEMNGELNTKIQPFLNIMNETMNYKDMRSFFQKRNKYGALILMQAAGKNGKIFETLWNFAENYFGSEEFKQILFDENRFGGKNLTFLQHTMTITTDSLFERVLNFVTGKLNNEELKNALLASNSDDENLLFFTMKHYNDYYTNIFQKFGN
jgi:hypothetical protein